MFRKLSYAISVLLAAGLCNHCAGVAGSADAPPQAASPPPPPSLPPPPGLSAAESVAELGLALPAGATGASISALIDPIIQALSNLAATFGGDVSIVAGELKTQLSILLDQFKDMLHSEINVPLANLGIDVQDVARQALSVSERINFLLKNQQKCATQNIGTMIAAFQTVLLEMKSGVPFVHAGTSRVDYFIFDGHAANVVPKAGGRATVRGFRLWSDPLPIIDIRDEARAKVLLPLTAQRASNDNELSVQIDSGFIAANVGKCVQLHVQTRRKSGLLHRRTEPVTDMYEPMCIPLDYATSIKLSGAVAYTCPNTTQTTLEQKIFYFDNSSCEDRKNVSRTERWVLPKDDCKIISPNDSPGGLNHNQSSIGLSFSNDSVTAAGWLDTASCGSVPFIGKKLFHVTDWQRLVSPRVSCVTHDQKVASKDSDYVSVTLPDTHVCVDVDKSCNEPGTQFWFSLSRKTTSTNPEVIYQAPRTAVGTASASPQDVMTPAGLVSATYTAPPVNGKAQVCVTLHTASCDY